MIKGLKIQNFRNLDMEERVQVKERNLLLGESNTGKTNVLMVLELIKALKENKLEEFVDEYGGLEVLLKRKKQPIFIDINLDKGDIQIKLEPKGNGTLSLEGEVNSLPDIGIYQYKLLSKEEFNNIFSRPQDLRRDEYLLRGSREINDWEEYKERSSEGILRGISLVNFLFNNKDKDILVIESPEIGLSIRNQEVVGALIENRTSSQVFCSTHSPYIIDSFDPEDILVLHKTFGTDSPKFSRQNQKRLEAWLEEGESLSDLFYRGLLH